MGPAGPAEVPGAGSVSVGRTQTDRLLRVLPKTGPISMNQLRLAAAITGQDQVRVRGSSLYSVIQLACGRGPHRLCIVGCFQGGQSISHERYGWTTASVTCPHCAPGWLSTLLCYSAHGCTTLWFCCDFVLQARLSSAAALHLSLELPSLDVSLVDGQPQELVLLSLDGLTVEYHAGNSAGITYTQVRTSCTTYLHVRLRAPWCV